MLRLKQRAEGIASAADVVEQFGDTITALDLVDVERTSVPRVSWRGAASFFGLGSTTIEVAAQDLSGNTTTSSLVVTVVDTTAPAITSAAGLSLEATGPEGYTGTTDDVIAAIQVADLVDPAPVVTLAEGVSTPFPLGTTEVGVTVTDAQVTLLRDLCPSRWWTPQVLPFLERISSC